MDGDTAILHVKVIQVVRRRWCLSFRTKMGFCGDSKQPSDRMMLCTSRQIKEATLVFLPRGKTSNRILFLFFLVFCVCKTPAYWPDFGPLRKKQKEFKGKSFQPKKRRTSGRWLKEFFLKFVTTKSYVSLKSKF